MRRLLLVCVSAGLAAIGAEVAGNVNAEKGLSLNGQSVPVAGTKTWPVSTGDELKSASAPVVLTMKDGSKIVLGANSQARVEAGTVRLVSGTMRYDLAQKSSLQVAVKNEILGAKTGVASTVGSVVAPVVTATATTEDLPPVSRRRP